MTGETPVQSEVRIVAPLYEVILLRNNSGVLRDKRGIPVRFGLGNDSERINEKFKSPDLIGWGPDGRFVAIECKNPDWIGVRTQRERAQEAFLEVVRRSNGLGAFVTNIEQFHQLMALFRYRQIHRDRRKML